MTRQLWPGLFLFTPIADDYKQLKVQHLPQTSEDGDGGAYFAPLDAAVVFGRKPDGFGDLLLGKFFVLTALLIWAPMYFCMVSPPATILVAKGGC